MSAEILAVLASLIFPILLSSHMTGLGIGLLGGNSHHILRCTPIALFLIHNALLWLAVLVISRITPCSKGVATRVIGTLLCELLGSTAVLGHDIIQIGVGRLGQEKVAS